MSLPHELIDPDHVSHLSMFMSLPHCLYDRVYLISGDIALTYL